MSEYETTARPYAQAVFELARQNDEFQGWADALALMAAVAADPRIQELAQSPRVDKAALATLLEDIGGDTLFPQAKNFIRVLVSNGRVFALPSIASQFQAMRAEAEGTIEAELISAHAVNEDQQTAIADSLSKRLGLEVSLRVSQDPSLIGGAVLRAGDLVVDASVKGQLHKLAASLAH